PLTPNGKVDRKALPEPDFQSSADSRAPRIPLEELLCGVFAKVLRQDSVGIDDSFFDLGGDSITSMQLVARAKEVGVVLTVKDVFEQRTVAGLATVATVVDDSVTRKPDVAVGEVRPTPIMHWLLDRGEAVDGYSQSTLVRTPAGLGEASLCSVLQAVLDHHDALRLTLAAGGGRRMEVRPVGSVLAADCLTRIDAAGLDGDQLVAAVDEHGAAARESLAPRAGVMLRAVWFDAGADTQGRLLLVANHLVVDAVSWQILRSDLATAWEALADGGAPELAATGTSMRRWSEHLVTEAASPDRVAEMSLWTDILSAPDVPVGERPLDGERDLVGTVQSVTMTLPTERTAPLLSRVPSAFHCGVDEVLVTAMALALAHRRQQRANATDTSSLIALEGHGRQEIADGVDLSRTVGWFTSVHPVRLDPGVVDWTGLWSGEVTAGRLVKRLKEQLRAVPDNGIGYGLLRYLNEHTGRELAALSVPTVGFNYLGRIEAPDEGPRPAPWTLAAEVEAVRLGNATGLRQPYALELNAATVDRAGGPELVATWSWPAAVMSEKDVQETADTWFRVLDALIAHVDRPEAGGHTPSDVALSALDQDEINLLEEEWRNS
ncbi:condensation domain-containing protein, partial [Amycolatopsis cihanbeyliensis]